MSEPNINWDEVVKKEARGSDNADLGKDQSVEQGFVVTRRGSIAKHSYYFPKITVN